MGYKLNEKKPRFENRGFFSYLARKIPDGRQ